MVTPNHPRQNLFFNNYLFSNHFKRSDPIITYILQKFFFILFYNKNCLGFKPDIIHYHKKPNAKSIFFRIYLLVRIERRKFADK